LAEAEAILKHRKTVFGRKWTYGPTSTPSFTSQS
ncbi:hypothetical protein Q604_UNBC17242G0002, partial [human gut metagenome]